MKKISNKNISNYFIYSPLIIFLSILFMSIGYATVNSVDLFIDGTGVAMEQTGLFISEAVYSSDDNANVANSGVKPVSGTVLHSQISLSSIPTDTDSSITYKITIYNAYDYDCKFVDAVFDSSFYDNSNITFEISDELNTNLVLAPTDSVIFYITFKYVSGVTPSESINALDAYVNFKFIRAPYILASYSTPGSYNYVIPEDGIYRFQLWGASGNGGSVYGQGGFVQGDIELTADTELFLYVGGKGTQLSSATKGTNDGGGYNGGGNANNDGNEAAARYGGGGATDVRLVGGEWNLFESLKSRIMVAGGGGSLSQSPYNGGNSGGLIGYGDASEFSGGGGTQTSGGLGKTALYGTALNGGFGYGSDGYSYASGGGSGYYGGAGGSRDKVDGSGGGGSSFISGHNGCDAIDEISTETLITHTGQSIHYSGYSFTNTIMIDGAGYSWTDVVGTEVVGIPNYDASGTLSNTATRNGYAIIWRVPTELN